MRLKLREREGSRRNPILVVWLTGSMKVASYVREERRMWFSFWICWACDTFWIATRKHSTRSWTYGLKVGKRSKLERNRTVKSQRAKQVKENCSVWRMGPRFEHLDEQRSGAEEKDRRIGDKPSERPEQKLRARTSRRPWAEAPSTAKTTTYSLSLTII